MTASIHDPGGKVRTPIVGNVSGDAIFSHCGRYRPQLTRTLPDGDGRCLWIGMNPSTADATHNDPTITRELDFTRRFGFSTYIKVNVMDYRATNPKDLLSVEIPSSIVNLSTILLEASYASCIIAAWGSIHKSLSMYSNAVENALHNRGYQLFCLGTTKDGSPRHPLYLPKTQERIPYRPDRRKQNVAVNE